MAFMLVTTVLMLTSTGFGQQQFTLELPPRTLLCNSGLRGGIDTYLMTGKIGPNYIDLVNTGWSTLVTIQVLPVGANQFSEICTISFGRTAQLCDSASTSFCYCEQYNDTTGWAHFKVVSTAITDHSNGIVRGQWLQINESVFYSTNNITLPLIQEVNAASMELKVNGKAVEENSDSCGSSFILCSMNTLELCCSSSTSPCYPRITLNDVTVAENKSPCVNYTFKVEKDNFTSDVTKSYSYCTFNDYIKKSTCVMKTEPTAVALNMKVNGNPTKKINGLCEIDFILEIVNILELCCSNTETPCYPRITFDGVIITGNSHPCVSFRFMPQSLQYTVSVSQSYAVCTMDKYITETTCVGKTIQSNNSIRKSVNINNSPEFAITWGILVLTSFLILFTVAHCVWKVHRRTGETTSNFTGIALDKTDEYNEEPISWNFKRRGTLNDLTDEFEETKYEKKKSMYDKVIELEHWSDQSETEI